MDKLTPFVAILREGTPWLYEWPAAGLIDELYRDSGEFPNGAICAQINKGMSAGPWRTEMLLGQYGPGSYEFTWSFYIKDAWPVEPGQTMLIFQIIPVEFDAADAWSGPNFQIAIADGHFLFSFRGDSDTTTVSAPATHELCSFPVVVDEINDIVMRITPDFNRRGAVEIIRNGLTIGKASGITNAFNNTNMNFFAKYGIYRWAPFPAGVESIRVHHSDLAVKKLT